MEDRQNVEARTENIGAGSPASRQVAWLETYDYVARLAAEHHVVLDLTAIAGTPQWCGMPDGDARKLMALLVGGVREALANDARQEAMAEASRSVAAAVNWRAVGRPRPASYIPREVA